VKAVYTELHRSHDPQFFLVRGVVKRTTEQPERGCSRGSRPASTPWSSPLCSARGRGHACIVRSI
jgi:hypothetical protein